MTLCYLEYLLETSQTSTALWNSREQKQSTIRESPCCEFTEGFKYNFFLLRDDHGAYKLKDESPRVYFTNKNGNYSVSTRKPKKDQPQPEIILRQRRRRDKVQHDNQTREISRRTTYIEKHPNPSYINRAVLVEYTGM